MKKIIYFISSLLLLIIINGCAGYEPIFGSENLKFKIVNYSIEGDKILGNKIYSKFYNLSQSNKDNQDIRNINLYINLTKSKTGTSKNIAGKILEYKINLSTKIRIQDNVTNKNILNSEINLSGKYKIQDQYSKTLNLENQLIENLINNMYQDLLITFSNNLETQ